MSRSERHHTETPATQFLKKHQVEFQLQGYDYVEHGGTAESARQLGAPEHQVIKTLIMEDEQAKPMVVLMHGTHEVSTKNLARQIGVKKVQPCKPEVAQRHSGYQVGGTSPFGTRKPMPVYIESSILDLDRIWINAGRRGLLLSMSPAVLPRLLDVRLVQVAN